MIKITLSIIALTICVFMPAVPYAAFEQFATYSHMLSAHELDTMRGDVNMIAMYTVSVAAGLCVAVMFGLMFYLAKFLVSRRSYHMQRNYYVW